MKSAQDMQSSVRKKNILWISLFVFITLCGLFLLGFYIGNLGSSDSIFRKITFIKTQRFKLTRAEVEPGYSKTKKVSQAGGSLTIVDKEGVKITATIPPNALESETGVSLSLLQNPPIENYDAGEESPGILLEPVDIKFKIPVNIAFDFNPQDDSSNNIFQTNPPNISSSVEDDTSESAAPVANRGEEELTESERTRRQHTRRRDVKKSSAIVHTDSSKERAGNIVYLSLSNKNIENAQIETQTGNGGTYSFDSQVAQEEAKIFIEEVLNNPNATLDQVLEAAVAAQAWGLEGLNEKVLKKLEEKVDQASNEFGEKCKGKGVPVSKKEILKWQVLAQSLGFENIETKLESLLKLCGGYFHFKMSKTFSHFTMNYEASVCGFIDDTWKGSTYGWYHSGVTGPIESTSFTFSLPPGGGTVTTTPLSVTATACLPEVCSTSSSGTFPVGLNFDGIDTITLTGDPTFTAKIEHQKGCGSQ